MNDKLKGRHPDKSKVHIKDTAGFTLRRAVLSGTAGVVGAAGALAKANKAFRSALPKSKDKKKNPHKD